jgi:hypothetical protein
MIIKVKHMRKNSGYLVTLPNSSNIVCLDKRSLLQGDEKGNKVTSILTHILYSFHYNQVVLFCQLPRCGIDW